MNKCASCKSFYEPILKPNGKYYKSCNRCLLKSKKKIDNIDNTIDNIDNIDNTIEKIDNIQKNRENREIDNTLEKIDNIQKNRENREIDNTNNNIIDEYLNIIKIKDSIIEKLTTDNKNLNIIVNDYKITLSQQQQTQQTQQTQQITTKADIKNDDRLNDFIKQLMGK